VVWKGFELHPETPPGGIELGRLFGEARVAAMRPRLQAVAESFGIRGMGSPERLPNTRRALAMAEYARDHGRLDAFREAAMQAHWQEGKDLEDDADLRAIAASAGLEPDAALAASRDERFLARVDAAREEANARGVTGIPTFFFGDVAVVGCQPYEELAAAAQAAGAERR